jgi:hypothetical protein
MIADYKTILYVFIVGIVIGLNSGISLILYLLHNQRLALPINNILMSGFTISRLIPWHVAETLFFYSEFILTAYCFVLIYRTRLDMYKEKVLRCFTD